MPRCAEAHAVAGDAVRARMRRALGIEDDRIIGKPIVCFVYTLEFDRDELRGVSFDFEPEPPGPLGGTTDDVLSALEELHGVRVGVGEHYVGFPRPHNRLDDGQGSRRMVDRVFSELVET